MCSRSPDTDPRHEEGAANRQKRGNVLPQLQPIARASLLLLVLLGGLASKASALSFQADFTSTTYQVVAGDTYADLLAQHLLGTPLASVTTTGLEGVSAQVEAGVNSDYSILMTAVLDIAVSGQYEFQVGADWGRGGVAAVIDNASGLVIQELVRTDDIWWGNSWSNPDVFTTQIQLDQGSSYTLAWLGFEGCCGGVTTVRFSFEGLPFEPVDELTVEPYVVPEPNTGLLVGIGLAVLARWRRPKNHPIFLSRPFQ